jgi:hypothetical protein
MQDRSSPDWQNGKDLSPPGTIAPAEVEAELAKILASSIFRNAPRHSRFLNFVVNKGLAGEGAAVKEYLIGLEVFDRKPDFDPATDPVVRSEARRLRLRLADYYRNLGQPDPIHIDLPKGTYVPVFYRNGSAPRPSEVTETQVESIPVLAEPRNNLIVPLVYKPSRRRFAVAAVVIVAIVVAGYFASGHPAKLTDKDSIVLAEFDNKTGDAIFDDTLKQGLSVQLEQSPFLDLVSDRKVNDTLKLMGRTALDRLRRL